MTPGELRRAQVLFEGALAEDPSARAEYLERACGADGELRRLVEELLESDAEDRGVLPEPFVRPALPPPLGSRAGAVEDDALCIGPYRVLAPIGRGGTSLVFLVERLGDPGEEMALKLVAGDLDPAAVEASFRSELAILESLDHPALARLLDAGRSEEGWPFFVMEYVDGLPITELCDARQLDVEGRLALFAQVCEAVEYAHRNLVVHRDLKPSNILVDETGRVRLLDFGVAKLLDVADRQEPTEASVRRLTPSYAAPEHLRGDRATTASDVYSLGVLLYELLTGARPFPWRGLSRGEILERWQTAEPRLPSAVVSSPRPRSKGWPWSLSRATDGDGPREERAARRGATPRELERRLAGDLDNIVLRALRFEPERRYGSVRELAEDLERHLSGLPVRARPSTWSYRWGRLLRRHRWAVANAAALAALLAGLAVVSLLASLRLTEERDQAEAQRLRAERVTEFLVGTFELADPASGLGRRISAQELLDRGALRLTEEVAADPETRSALQHTLGRLYVGIGMYDAAEEQLAAALAWRRTSYGVRDPRTAETLRELAAAWSWKGDLEQATAAAREALAIRRERFGDGSVAVAESRRQVGELLRDAGRWDEAEGLLEAALASHRRELGEASAEVAKDLGSLATLWYLRGEYRRTEETARRALEVSRGVFPAGSLTIAEALELRAAALASLGEPEEAESLYRESLDLLRARLGPDHARVAAALNNLGNLKLSVGELEAAESLLRHASCLMQGALGAEHPDVGRTLANLGWVLMARNRLPQAAAAIRRAVEIHRRAFSDDHPVVGRDLHYLGSTLFLLGDLDGAEEALRGALRVSREREGERSARTGELRTILGRVLRERGRFVEAEEQYRLALEAFRASTGEESWLPAVAEMRIAEVLCDRERPEEAETLARRALVHLEQHEEPERLMRLEEARGILGTALAAQGRAGEARDALVASYESLLAAKGETAKQTHEALLRLIAFFEARGELTEAARYRSRLPALGAAPAGDRFPGGGPEGVGEDPPADCHELAELPASL